LVVLLTYEWKISDLESATFKRNYILFLKTKCSWNTSVISTSN